MASDIVVLWLVGAELELAVAEVADGSREVSGVLAVVGVLGWKKLALDCNNLMDTDISAYFASCNMRSMKQV